MKETPIKHTRRPKWMTINMIILLIVGSGKSVIDNLQILFCYRYEHFITKNKVRYGLHVAIYFDSLIHILIGNWTILLALKIIVF